MTRPQSPAGEEVPVGTATDEQQDTDAVLADAAGAADEDALADAGLPRDPAAVPDAAASASTASVS